MGYTLHEAAPRRLSHVSMSVTDLERGEWLIPADGDERGGYSPVDDHPPGTCGYVSVVDTETLGARRAAVQARLRALDKSFDDVVESIRDVGNDDEHDPDGSTIAFERAQLIALRRAALVELHELDAALARLAAGTFGTCTVCGDAIGRERLEALPSTTTCVACAT